MQPIFMIYGIARDLADNVNRTKFGDDRFKDLGLRKGHSLGFPIGNRSDPNHCVFPVVHTRVTVTFTAARKNSWLGMAD